MQKKSFSTFIVFKCSHTEKFGPPNVKNYSDTIKRQSFFITSID